MENKGPREEFLFFGGPLVSWSTEAVSDRNEVLTMVPFLEGKDGNAPLNKALSHPHRMPNRTPSHL